MRRAFAAKPLRAVRASASAAPLCTRRASSAADAFRRWGHLEACIEPLQLTPRPRRSELPAEAGDPEVARLRQVYCGAIGAEFEHLDRAAEREWWARALERLVPADGGFGLSTGDPNVVSWGRMIGQNRSYLLDAWWTVTFPGLALFLTVLSVALIGDGINDALDPRS